MTETGAEVIGLDWRIPLDEGWQHAWDTTTPCRAISIRCCCLPRGAKLKQRAEHILRLADGRPGHIFNLGHGILPHTPVDNVKNLAQFVHEFSSTRRNAREDAMSKDAVLLIAHGSPERVEDIPEFLQNISRGRPMPEAVVREVQHRYSLIGSSPLTRITRQQADGVARELGLPAYVGMRNWHPFIADTLQQMTADGVDAARLRSALRRTIRAPASGSTSRCCSAANAPFAIDFVEEWHDHPLLIDAFAEKLRDGWAAACAEHGSRACRCCSPRTAFRSAPSRKAIPTRRRRARPRRWWPRRFRRSAAWRFAFQSQGMSGGEWLGPTVEDTIASCEPPVTAACSCSPSASSATTSRFCSTSTSCSGNLPANAA